ncbi:MAG: AgmX/PglI C-terminal domain-containing protein [Polyangiaceae bacterium]|nr:AgmX/PglI C-terminal domain-containing protein [Polyangiaceae bacterium]
MAKDFRRCYQLALKDDPNAKGSVRISAKIGPKGEVVSATPTEAKGLPQPVILCITDVVRSRTFDAPEGGTLVIPLSFAGGQPPCDPKSDPLCTPP